MLLAHSLRSSCAFEHHFPHSTCSHLQHSHLAPILTGRDLKPRLPAGLCSFRTLLFYSRNKIGVHMAYKAISPRPVPTDPAEEPLLSHSPLFPTRSTQTAVLSPNSSQPALRWTSLPTYSHAPYLLITLRMAQRLFSSYAKTSTGKAAPTCTHSRR